MQCSHHFDSVLQAFSPTILFLLLCPRFLAVYHGIAVRLTKWENPAHKSTYNASLTLKTFALGAIVAYLALGLSAFVYVPFGEGVMLSVQTWLFSGEKPRGSFSAVIQDILNGTFTRTVELKPELQSSSEKAANTYSGLWDVNTVNVRAKLNPSRLRDQMFAYTVTNQVINSFMEIGLPYILRWVADLRNKKGNSHSKNSTPPAINSNSSASSDTTNTPRKRVVFEDEKERGGLEERVFLDRVRHEAALPEYDLFVDYNEMVIQFGYVAVWSTIWPLAGGEYLIYIRNLMFVLRNFCSDGIPKQPSRIPIGRVQDDCALPSAYSDSHRYHWTMDGCAHVPHVACCIDERCTCVPILTSTDTYYLVVHLDVLQRLRGCRVSSYERYRANHGDSSCVCLWGCRTERRFPDFI